MTRFGICCLFLFSTSGSTINQNCSYIRNPGFPSAFTATSSVTYTIQKCSTGTTLNALEKFKLSYIWVWFLKRLKYVSLFIHYKSKIKVIDLSFENLIHRMAFDEYSLNAFSIADRLLENGVAADCSKREPRDIAGISCHVLNCSIYYGLTTMTL